MKLFLMTLLLAVYLIAAPQTTSKLSLCQLKKILKRGWDDTNTTLKQAIIKLKKTEIPQIIAKLDQPIKSPENNDSVWAIPKLELTKGDYIKLLAYLKYLESSGKKDSVLSIYIKSFQGIHNIKDTSMIAAIFRIAINNLLTDSLHDTLQQKLFTKTDKQYLYEKLSKMLILDNRYIILAIQSEKNITSKLISQMKENKYDKRYMDIYVKEFQKVNAAYWDILLKATKANNIPTVKKNEEKKLFKFILLNAIKLFLAETKMTIYKTLGLPLNKQDYVNHARYSANKLLFTSRPKLYSICQDYLNMTHYNKQLLKTIKDNL